MGERPTWSRCGTELETFSTGNVEKILDALHDDYSPWGGTLDIAVTGLSLNSASIRFAGERGFMPVSIYSGSSIPKTHWETYEEAALVHGHTPNRAKYHVSQSVFVAETDKEAKRLAMEGGLGIAFTRYLWPIWERFVHQGRRRRTVRRRPRMDLRQHLGRRVAGDRHREAERALRVHRRSGRAAGRVARLHGRPGAVVPVAAPHRAGSRPQDPSFRSTELVEALDRRIVATVADVRDGVALRAAVTSGVAELGRLDTVAANAGIFSLTLDEPTDPAERRQFWQDTIDVNLTGVWNTVDAAAPILIEGGRGGAVVLTASTAASKSAANGSLALDAYTAAKHGVVRLMRNLTVDLAPHMIRVNTVHPTGVHTPMVENAVVDRYMEHNPSFAKLMANALPIDAVDPVDISNAVVFLASDMARFVTGVQLPVDAGFLVK